MSLHSLQQQHEEALFKLDKTGGGINLALAQVYVKAHVTDEENEEHDFTIFARNASGATKITSEAVTASSLTAGT